MLISRLLPVSLLIAVLVASVAAQSSPEKNPVVVPSAGSGQLNPSDSTDLLSLRLELLRLNQSGLPRGFVLGPEGLLQDDTLCYAMRSYKVARDNPQSDSTHAAGYSTCQPAARFHVHSIELRTSPSAP